MAFADSFTFSRPTAEPYTDGAGVTRTADVDQPRFDHSGPGRPIGLLVDGGATLGQGDRAVVIPGGWATLPKSTILHEWFDGSVVRAEAHYATDPAAMIDGCLVAAGHHRRIAVMAGYLRNYGGWVWAIEQRWYLPRLVGAGGGAALANSDAAPVIAS